MIAQIMTASAITPEGGLSADWVLVISFTVIGVLIVTITSMVGRHFIKTLDRIEKSVENAHGRLDKLELKEVHVDGELKRIKEDRDGILERIFEKLDSLG